MSNDRVKESIKKQLFALGMGECYLPDCDNKLVFEGSNVGRICHIFPRNSNGPRSNEDAYKGLSDEFLNSIENLIACCPNHAQVIDEDLDKYSSSILFEIKKEVEDFYHTSTSKDRYFNKNNKPLVSLYLGHGFRVSTKMEYRAIILENFSNEVIKDIKLIDVKPNPIDHHDERYRYFVDQLKRQLDNRIIPPGKKMVYNDQKVKGRLLEKVKIQFSNGDDRIFVEEFDSFGPYLPRNH